MMHFRIYEERKMTIEYYIKKRTTKDCLKDKLIETCETSEQAWAHIQAMPKAEQSLHYVQYSPDALDRYVRNLP